MSAVRNLARDEADAMEADKPRVAEHLRRAAHVDSGLDDQHLLTLIAVCRLFPDDRGDMEMDPEEIGREENRLLLRLLTPRGQG